MQIVPLPAEDTEYLSLLPPTDVFTKTVTVRSEDAIFLVVTYDST